MSGTGGTPTAPQFGKGLKVLVVDDDASIRVVLTELLGDVGFTLDLADCLTAGKATFKAGRYDLVITDKNLGDGSGLDLVQLINAEAPDTEVIIMSAFASLESAVEAIQMRVADYLVKPFEDIDAVLDRIQRVVQYLNLKRENRALVDEICEKNARLEELVVRDGLTGLFNHAYFQERLESEVKRSARHGHCVSLVFVDIDHFKEVNDTLGHQVGDGVLKIIAETLRGESRVSDDTFRLREHDIAARYGGDEFVLMLPETPKSGAAIKAERLRSWIEAQKFQQVGRPVTLSMGIAEFPTDGPDRPSLIKAADAALYAAKRMGRNRVMSYSPTLAPADGPAPTALGVAETATLALEATLEGHAFHFLYQPIVDARSWKVVGYEALCRPTHPAFPTVRDLLLAAEHAGRVVDLGRLLRHLAIEPVTMLGADFQMYVNLHPSELNDPSLFSADNPLRPFAKQVVFEITETTAMADQARIKTLIKKLRELGFKVALDDLASGYAGLSALAQLEVEYVKLGRTLMQNLTTDSRGGRLVRHIVEYAAAEGLVVVAEGIETEDQAALMLQLGCPLLQGFYFGHPEPPFRNTTVPTEISARLDERRAGG